MTINNNSQGEDSQLQTSTPTATQEECLEIALLGKTAWNNWQQNTPIEYIDFSGIDFGAKQINFSNFIFESRVNFKNSKFGTTDNCNFVNVKFKKGADFKNCIFENDALFNNSSFYRVSFFDKIQFKKGSNFSKSEFKDGPEFSNSEFNGPTNFKQSIMPESASFNNSKFFSEATFSNTTFTGSASFQRCIFYKNVIFNGAKFESIVLFIKTQFKSDANFKGVHFKGRALFNAAEFRGNVYLANTKFPGESNFAHCQFGGLTNFENTIFIEAADFRATQFLSDEPLQYAHQDSVINFSGAIFFKDALFNTGNWNSLRSIYGEQYDERKEWAEYSGVSAEKLASTDFRGSQFNGNASFQGRKFVGPTNFGPLVEKIDGKKTINMQVTIFKIAPNFHECEFHQNTTFHRATFPAPSGADSAARSYRTLKLAFSKKYDLRQEQNFYKLETLEELKSEKFSKRWISTLFKLLSDFGFSINRPLILMLISTVLALSIYGLLSDLEVCNLSSIKWDSLGKLLQFTLFAIPGFEKISLGIANELFPNGLGLWTILTLLLHKLIMLVGLFLFGLALRNLFKMK